MEKNMALFESIEPGAGQVLEDFLKETKWQYELSKAEFMYKNYNSIRDFMTLRVMRQGAKPPIAQEAKANHRKEIQERALAQGTAIPDCPPLVLHRETHQVSIH